jgi:hypothetical protein
VRIDLLVQDVVGAVGDMLHRMPAALAQECDGQPNNQESFHAFPQSNHESFEH